MLLSHLTCRTAGALARRAAAAGLLCLPALASSGNPDVTFAVSSSSGGETAGSQTVTIELSQAAATNVQVPFTLGGTAVQGVDYQIDASPLVFPAGSTSENLTITPLGDPLYELDETVVVTLGTPTGADLGATTVHTFTLLDDDPQPEVFLEVTEDVVQEDHGLLVVRVRVTAVSGVETVVPFQLLGQAIEGVDFTIDASPAIIPAGANNAPVLLTVLNDGVVEPDKSLGITIDATGVVGAAIGDPTSVAFLIEDDDAAPPAVISLRPSTLDVGFEDLRVGQTSAPQRVQILNSQSVPVVFGGLRKAGERPEQFDLTYERPLPIVLVPGQSTFVDVAFDPSLPGEHRASLFIRQSPFPGQVFPVQLQGRAYGVLGEDLLVHAGLDPYIDASGAAWAAEYGLGGSGLLAVSSADVAGTDDDTLYQTARRGAVFDYQFDLPNGPYEVTLRFSEQDPIAAGARVFDVLAEGLPLLTNFDIVATAGASDQAISAGPYVVDVTDGALDLDFVGVVGEAQFQALEVRAFPDLVADVSTIEFGSVDQGSPAVHVIQVSNPGLMDTLIDRVRFRILPDQGVATDFSIVLDGETYAGGVSTLGYQTAVPVLAGETFNVPLTFDPTEHADHTWSLHLERPGNKEVAVIVTGTGGADPGWGFLHPIPDKDVAFLVDYDGSGSEDVQFRGAESHTHEPGHILLTHDWLLNGAPAASTEDPVINLPLGNSTVTLTIGDDNLPPATASDTLDVTLHPVTGVVGALKLYYDTSGIGGALANLGAPPARADHVERGGENLEVTVQGGKVGPSELDGDTVVAIEFDFDSPAPETLEFLLVGGAASQLIVDGALTSGPQALAAGPHSVVARFAVVDLGDLPVRVDVLDGGGQPDPAFSGRITHDETGRVPVIHAMPSEGLDLGGNLVRIDGFGFFPENDVTVHWGGTDLTQADFQSWTGEAIEILTPPGSGTIQVTVETSQGVSNARPFTYSNTGPVPVNWTRLDAQAHLVAGGTSLAWGPDGKLYVGRVGGRIRAIEFDDAYNVVSWTDHAGVQGLTNGDLLGITFNPYDPPSPVKLYVAHGEHFLNGGGSFSGPSPYTGQVSVLTGPSFDSPVPLITGLPTSNHDHAVNGIEFDDNGDLMICVGGNTNAGVVWPLIGDLPESPLSAAVLRARTSDPAFDGAITYEITATGVPTIDQVDGEISDQSGGDVSVYASGLRNSYDLVLHTNGYWYATDNGPNTNYGPASLDATTVDSGPQPSDYDELHLLEQYGYHGHPNRARGRYDDRENLYHPSAAPTVLGVMSGSLAVLDSSVNGLTEYRATAFNSAIRGRLLGQKWNSPAKLMELAPDGRSILAVEDVLPVLKGLDVETGPGGAILTADYSNNLVRMMVPNDVAATGLTAYDIHPWRAPAGGGAYFVIGGSGFGTLGTTSVTIGGVPAALTSVSPTRITGTVPMSPGGQATDLVDVVVTVGVDVETIPDAFRWLAPNPGAGQGVWKPATPMPDPLGEVSAELIDGKIYVMGEGSNKTYAYDIASDTWDDSLAVRPFPGNHHACEVFEGKLYLIGGLGSGQGKVQIYDPVLDSWSLGADMPWSGGSVVSTLIGGRFFVGGGIVSNFTVNNFSTYDPSVDEWDLGGAITLPAMPTGVNHAASATDGTKMYVFGGRAGGNIPQPGFTNVQVFNTATLSWEDSSQPSSSLAPLPQGRGGTGRAVSFGGEFFVFGGETSGGVFDEVYVYDPVGNVWREEKGMLTPRHGIFPVVVGHRIFCIGGGVVAGFSASAVNEFLVPR